MNGARTPKPNCLAGCVALASGWFAFVVFSVYRRERACEWLLERAEGDARVAAGAAVGAEAHGSD